MLEFKCIITNARANEKMIRFELCENKDIDNTILCLSTWPSEDYKQAQIIQAAITEILYKKFGD